MGYGYYEIHRPDQKRSDKPMERGYCVEDTCHHPECTKEIDRGMAYLCYSCTWYFCDEHLVFDFKDRLAPRQFECFAGQSGQACEDCHKTAPPDEYTVVGKVTAAQWKKIKQRLPIDRASDMVNFSRAERTDDNAVA